MEKNKKKLNPKGRLYMCACQCFLRISVKCKYSSVHVQFFMCVHIQCPFRQVPVQTHAHKLVRTRSPHREHDKRHVKKKHTAHAQKRQHRHADAETLKTPRSTPTLPHRDTRTRTRTHKIHLSPSVVRVHESSARTALNHNAFRSCSPHPFTRLTQTHQTLGTKKTSQFVFVLSVTLIQAPSIDEPKFPQFVFAPKKNKQATLRLTSHNAHLAL